MLDLLVIWAGLLVALVAFGIGRPGKGGALTLAYFLGLSLIHVPGVLPFLNPDAGLGDWEETQLGFETTVVGMAAFIVGALLARWMNRSLAEPDGAAPRWRGRLFGRLGWRSVVFGGLAWFVLLPLSSRVPSLTSVVAPLGTMLIAGLWLALYGAVLAGDRWRILAILAALPLLPLATLVAGGFLGYGTNWVLSVLAFLFVISRRRTWFYASTPVAIFLGLSLFVTYIGQRADIREVVWYERPDIFDRLSRISALVTDFQFLDLSSPKHATALDDRLNQNWLVGGAIIYQDSGFAEFAYGDTVPLWALIPRAVWPDKPEIGGGRDVVSEFTGLKVPEGTSVGAGQVLEFYVNFGIPGVLIGFFGLGYLFMRLDEGIRSSLAADDLRGFLLRVMPGLTLLQPGGNLLELLVGCLAALISAHLVISLGVIAVPLSGRSPRVTDLGP